MIQANELRAGNWINYYNSNTYFQVTEIGKTMLEVENSEESTWIELDQFSPIPLTPELLERAGFDGVHPYSKDVYHLNGLTIALTKDAKNIGIWQSANEPIRNIRYVHQLQNLFYALTGKEIEITL